MNELKNFDLVMWKNDVVIGFSGHYVFIEGVDKDYCVGVLPDHPVVYELGDKPGDFFLTTYNKGEVQDMINRGVAKIIGHAVVV